MFCISGGILSSHPTCFTQFHCDKHTRNIALLKMRLYLLVVSVKPRRRNPERVINVLNLHININTNMFLNGLFFDCRCSFYVFYHRMLFWMCSNYLVGILSKEISKIPICIAFPTMWWELLEHCGVRLKGAKMFGHSLATLCRKEHNLQEGITDWYLTET